MNEAYGLVSFSDISIQNDLKVVLPNLVSPLRPDTIGLTA